MRMNQNTWNWIYTHSRAINLLSIFGCQVVFHFTLFVECKYRPNLNFFAFSALSDLISWITFSRLLEVMGCGNGLGVKSGDGCLLLCMTSSGLGTSLKHIHLTIILWASKLKMSEVNNTWIKAQKKSGWYSRNMLRVASGLPTLEVDFIDLGLYKFLELYCLTY